MRVQHKRPQTRVMVPDEKMVELWYSSAPNAVIARTLGISEDSLRVRFHGLKQRGLLPRRQRPSQRQRLAPLKVVRGGKPKRTDTVEIGYSRSLLVSGLHVDDEGDPLRERLWYVYGRNAKREDHYSQPYPTGPTAREEIILAEMARQEGRRPRR